MSPTATSARTQGEIGNADIARSLGRIEGAFTGLEARISEMQRNTETQINALRQDVVAANTRLLTQASDHESRLHSVEEKVRDTKECVQDHESRIGVLEDDRAARGGAISLARFARDFGPWIFGLLGWGALVIK